MNRIYFIIFCCYLLFFLYSCKKGGTESVSNGLSVINKSAISGKWLSVKDHGKIYRLSDNSLLKDTTLNFTSLDDFYRSFDAANNSYVYTGPFEKAGSTILYNDTSSYLTYSISNNVLKFHQDGDDPNNFETEQILLLNSTTLETEDTYTSDIPDSQWNITATYPCKYIEDYTFIKQ